jgi:hypothetical protein
MAMTVIVRAAWRRLAGELPGFGESGVFNETATTSGSRENASDNSKSGDDNKGSSGGPPKPPSKLEVTTPSPAYIDTASAISPIVQPSHAPARSDSPTADRQTSATQAIQSGLGIVGLFAAPTTVITAVAYFFGYAYTRQFYRYFGIDSDAVGFTTTDYVMRSVNVFFLPLMWLLIGLGLFLWAGAYTRRLAQKGTEWLDLIRGLGYIATAVGGFGTFCALVSMLVPGLAVRLGYWVTPMALGLGAVSMLAGLWMVRTARAPSRPRPLAGVPPGVLVVAATAIVVAIYWLTSSWASTLAERNAEVFAATLWTRDAVVIETSHPLGVASSLIKQSILPSDPARFRYECFRVLAVRGDRWVLASARWTDQLGYALIVTADPTTSISVTRHEGIDSTDAASWEDGQPCPEVTQRP